MKGGMAHGEAPMPMEAPMEGGMKKARRAARRSMKRSDRRAAGRSMKRSARRAAGRAAGRSAARSMKRSARRAARGGNWLQKMSVPLVLGMGSMSLAKNRKGRKTLKRLGKQVQGAPRRVVKDVRSLM